MATMKELTVAREKAAEMTLKEIRDSLPEIDEVKIMQTVFRFDQLLNGNFSEEEIRAIYLGGLMVHLLPD